MAYLRKATAIDGGADSWLNYLDANIDISSNAIIDFPTTRLGTNITESAGSVTVAKAGWYLIFNHMGKNTDSDDYMQFYLRKNGAYTTQTVGRGYYESGAEVHYLAVSSTWFIELAATDVVEIYGQGNLFGQGNPEATMTYWGGIRLGA